MLHLTCTHGLPLWHIIVDFLTIFPALVFAGTTTYLSVILYKLKKGNKNEKK